MITKNIKENSMNEKVKNTTQKYLLEKQIVKTLDKYLRKIKQILNKRYIVSGFGI